MNSPANVVQMQQKSTYAVWLSQFFSVPNQAGEPSMNNDAGCHCACVKGLD